jgi:pyruvate dehydrogenase E1 component alpha subunit
MAELTGRAGGYSKGKGGSMHMFSREKKFYGGHGIVAAQVPIGAGLGFAHKYLNDGGFNACYMGDGAINQGQVYETFNMAALWKLPTLFVIENNKYAMGTAQARASAGELFERGSAYGIPGKQVNGMDVLEVRAAAHEAIEYIRAGNGPVILEMQTYRYRGHSMSDPAKYRTKEEVNKMRSESDPIDNLKKLLLEKGYADEESLKIVDREVKDIVTEAADFATTSPEPDPSELWTDILVEA